MPKQLVSNRQVFDVKIDTKEMRMRREQDAKAFDNICNKFLERFHGHSIES